MTKRLLMDIDYADLAYSGDGSRLQLAELFDRMAGSGFAGAIIDCFFNGQALYHSRRFPLFDNAARSQGHDTLVRRLHEFDPLAEALRLGRERKLEIYPYVRLTDEAFAPASGDPLFVHNPHYWYETRCGQYQLTGVPCFNFPQVRELFLRRCLDLSEHGAAGFFFSTSRSHAPYFVPYIGKEEVDIWGFNGPVAEEYFRRHGVDIRRTECVTVTTPDEPHLRGFRRLEFCGASPFDESEMRRILGDGFELFLRSVRRHFPAAYIGLELSSTSIAPGTNFPHNLFVLDLEKLVADGVVGEWFHSRNWRTHPERFEDLPSRFPLLRKHGAKIGAWLNDLLTCDGGSGSVPVETVAEYLRRFADSDLDSAVMHEAAYVLQHPRQSELWTLFNRACGPTL